MPVEPSSNAVLSRFRSAIDQAYGPRVERVVLYGSRARGEGKPGSDYDVAVFLRGITDRAKELDLLADVGTEILYDSGYLVRALPFDAGAYQQRTPLMHEIRKDGVDL